MSALVADRSNSKSQSYVCNFCSHCFTSQQTYDRHLSYGTIHPAQHVKYPDDPLLKFKAVQKQHTVPFFFVCDFESFIVPVHADEEQEEEDE